MKKKIAILLLTCLLLAGCDTQVRIETPTLPTLAVTEPVETTSVTQPPQTNPTQPPTEAAEPADDALVRVTAFIPEIRQNLRYATKDNFTGQQIYDFADAYLRYGTVRKLLAVSEELAGQGLGLLIWDGFRPVSAQEKLWEVCPDPAYVSHPVTGARSHCRGSAVDLTLYDLKTGEQLEMPTDFDDFSALADRDYRDCTENAAENARLLEKTMEKHGFKSYSAEWWHFSDTEQYSVDETFQPEQTVFDGGVG